MRRALTAVTVVVLSGCGADAPESTARVDAAAVVTVDAAVPERPASPDAAAPDTAPPDAARADGSLARDAATAETPAARPPDAAPAPPATVIGAPGMTVDMDGVATAFVVKKAQLYVGQNAQNLTVEGANASGNLVVAFHGTAPGTFPCGGDFYVSYTTPRGTWSTIASGGTCTITISVYGAVGQPIVGTFSATLPPFFGVTGTRKLTGGAFSATRAADNGG